MFVVPPETAYVCFGLVKEKLGNTTQPADFYPAPCMAAEKNSL